jgi:hypothetical protein
MQISYETFIDLLNRQNLCEPVRLTLMEILQKSTIESVQSETMPKIADYNKLLDLREKLVWGDILECYDKDELKKYVNENYKSKDIGLNDIGKKILAELEHMKYL